MNILHLMPATELAGTERATLELIHALRELNHHNEVMSLVPFGKLQPLLVDEGIPHHEINPRGWRGWRTYFSLRRQLPTIAADALLLGVLDLDTLPALRFSPARRRVLISHGPHHGRPTAYWRAAYGLALRYCDAIAFCSDFLRAEAEAYQPALRGRGHTIRNAVPVQAPPSPMARRRARQKLELGDDAFVIGASGRMVPGKRFDVLLDVARIVVDKAPETVLMIAGGGPDEAALQARATALGLTPHVRWLGWLPDLEDFYAAADVIQFHANAEPFGLSAAEAMARAIPVIASVIGGGLHEVLQEGVGGYCLGTHDVDALARHVLEMRGGRGRELGLSGRDRIAATCSPRRCAESMLRLLEPQQ